MPFPFTLPTTSSFVFSSCLGCDSHPSLPLRASTQRAILRDALKKHKRLPPSTQGTNLASIISCLEGYLPYLLAVDSSVTLRGFAVGREEGIHVVLKAAPKIQWRPTLSGDILPGRERPRITISSIEYEVFFVLSTLASSHVLMARSILQPLYSTTGDFVGARDRTAAIQSANKHLLDAASIYKHLATRSEHSSSATPCFDVAPTTARALAALALAEATLLAVTKDDPYPAAVAQDRSKTDKEWMFKAPDMPKPKAHLNARLCLAASDHATKAASLCQSPATTSSAGTGSKASPALAKYMDDLSRTSRAKACRFLGVHAEVDGQVAEAVGWLNAGYQALGLEANGDGKQRGSGKSLGFGRFRKELAEKREDRRVDKEMAWGADAGRLEEMRVLDMLHARWSKMNDTINTQPIPAINTLLAKMPSGREIHTVQPYKIPVLEKDLLETMRSVPDADDVMDVGRGEVSSEDEEGVTRRAVPVGAYPGPAVEYGSGRDTPGGSTYY